jgi:hypothetical protein
MVRGLTRVVGRLRLNTDDPENLLFTSFAMPASGDGHPG